MSEFEFAPMRKEYDYFSSPAAEKPSKSLSMYEALSSPAAGNDHSSFEFAKSAPCDFFGNVIEAKKTDELKPEVVDGFEFAPIRKEKGYFGWDEEVRFSNGHDHHNDCDCAGECHGCSAKIEKMTFRKGQKLRHVRTGKIYEMVKTLCTDAKECYCVLKEDGRERECLFYPGEVVAA